MTRAGSVREGVQIVIMAGGSGTRFWPLSRKNKPKQFLQVGESGRSLLQATCDRVLSLVGDRARVTVVTTEALKDLTSEHLPGVELLLEPMGRNTAASIGLAGQLAGYSTGRHEEDLTLIVLAADHLIPNEAGFRELLSRAIEAANRQDALVTLGVEPTYAHAGYGYIKVPADCGEEGAAVIRFVEKPAKATAEQYLKDGGYFWNSGMFIFRRSVINTAIEQQLPNLWRDLGSVKKTFLAEGRIPAETFGAIPSISIDVGVFERAPNVMMLPARGLGWNDIGSFEAWSECLPPDSAGNVIVGDGEIFDSQECIVHSEERYTALLGVSGVTVVVTPDAVLVCDRQRVQEIKNIVERLASSGRVDLT